MDALLDHSYGHTAGAEPGAEKLTQCGCIKNGSSSGGHSRLPPNGSQSYYIYHI